jgi:nicotinic acid mononucleotide adenylyltransferase
LELEDINFSVESTLPRLRRRFPNDQLVFLFGSDAAQKLANWPLAEKLLSGQELVVGLRGQDKRAQLEQVMVAWPIQPNAVTIIDSYAAAISSSKIRNGLRQRQKVDGLLSSVERYSGQNWLYVSLSQPSAAH